MKVAIPPICTDRCNHTEIVCAEKGRKIKFLNPQKREVVRYLIDGCTGLRTILGNPCCKLCDYAVVDWRSNEHYVELKGVNVEHALKQLESTVPRISAAGSDERIFCWIITSESPSTQSKFMVLKDKFQKRFNARLTIRTNQYVHTL